MKHAYNKAAQNGSSRTRFGVVAFRSQFAEGRPLDEVVRLGAQKMLQSAIAGEYKESGLFIGPSCRSSLGVFLVVREQTKRRHTRPPVVSCR